MKQQYLSPRIISFDIKPESICAASPLHDQGNGTTTGTTNPEDEFNGEFNAKGSLFDESSFDDLEDF